MKQIFIIIFAIFAFTAWIDPFKDEVEKGNSSYKSGNPKNALEHYKEAEKHLPDEKTKSVLDFNKGGAHYQLGNYDIAAEKFKNSISSEDPEIQKKALFNMGNSYLKDKKYKKAAESYIKALEIDPTYDKAKKNLEYLLNKQNDKNQNENNNEESKDEKQNNDKNKNKKNQSAAKEKSMKGIQAKNLLESMKNKPVRKQKGKGDGTKYLEKYW